MPEKILLEISLIWHSHEKFPSMWTSRGFEVDTCLIGNYGYKGLQGLTMRYTGLQVVTSG